MKRKVFVLIFIMSFLITSSTFNFASEKIKVSDYMKDKFPLMFNLYLASLEELDEFEKEFIDLLQELPEEEQEYYAKEVFKNGFSISLLDEIRSIKFEVWDKWEGRLPQMDSEYWSWLLPDQKTIPIKYDDEPVVFVSCFYYVNVENENDNILIILYYPGSLEVDLQKEYIPEAEFALALFPTEDIEKEIKVRAYERKNDILKFIEKWSIPFKDNLLEEELHEIVRYDVNSRDIFNDWLWSQELPAQLVNDSRGGVARVENLFLPILRINEKGAFLILWENAEIDIW